MRKLTQGIVLAAVFALTTATALAVAPQESPSEEWVRKSEQVRKSLVKLPFYSVFDNINYRVDGDTVYLTGQVRRPSLKPDSGRVVSRVEGINQVVNEIEVLPVSFYDDRLRVALARTIYRHPVFNRYGLQFVPPLHIIVKNGNVTLEGFVNSKLEKNVANILANQVGGVFSVTNNLRLDRS